MKKGYIQVIAFFMLMGSIGCSSKIETENTNYLICNDTSLGKMAETKNGYYFALDEILFYADKDNLSQWVAVCNKPDCIHMDFTCNAYLPSYNTIVQKNGKLYEVDYGNSYQKPYVFEIATDGSGLKKAYEISIGDNINPIGYGSATFPDRFLLQYGYLDEDGIYQEYVLRLEDDEKEKVESYTLYEGKGSDANLILSGNQYWNLRGDDVIVTTLFLEDGKDALYNLCKIDGEEIEPLNLPGDVSFARGYLSGDILTYYKEKEGFYQYNINTGDKELICVNQLEDGRGYILSEDCMIESNRYINYMPEEAILKVYNGEEWTELEIPEEISKSDNPFYPMCIASDRIFFGYNVIGEDSSTTTSLYYMMLEDENPELVFAGTIKKNSGTEEESSLAEETLTEEETEQESNPFENSQENFEEIVVFDIDEYLFKITDVYLDYANRWCIDMYFENKSDTGYYIFGNYCAINGLQCDTAWGDEVLANKTNTFTLRFLDSMLKESKISEIYSFDEYTDIEIGFQVVENAQTDFTKEKIIHIYPQGEENVVTFSREVQSTDQVLVDNENVSVVVTGYEDAFVPNDTINVLITNKTDQYMKVKVEEASANGIAIDADYHFGVYNLIINPGVTSIYPMALFDGLVETIQHGFMSDSFFKQNNITNIEKIEMKLKISYYDYVEGVVGEDFVYETFVLTP